MTKTPRISICIPTYDTDGIAARFLALALERLSRQSFTDFEVIVSDQSPTDEVGNTCNAYADRLQITRISGHACKPQSSANTNNAIAHARGDIIKILFQDDYLCRDDALAQIATLFDDPQAHWALVGSAVTHDGRAELRPMVPRLGPALHLGKNTVSSPSVLAFRAGLDLWFDENLIWLMDVDFYKSCALRLGPPAISPETLVVNRLHEGQVSNAVTRRLKRKELLYIWRKYPGERAAGQWIAFVRQFLKTLRLEKRRR
jgi:glycosyltransferase involved in cell wall biosynthesis